MLDIDVTWRHAHEVICRRFSARAIYPSRIHRRTQQALTRNAAQNLPDWLAERIKRAEMEMTFADKCDRVIYNDVLEDAVAETLQVVNQFLKAKQEQMA